MANYDTAKTEAAVSLDHETSLSKLTNSEWHQVSNQWCRGIDWCVWKLGRKWTVSERFGNFPLFKTKAAAYDAVTKLVLAESHHRAALENGAAA